MTNNSLANPVIEMKDNIGEVNMNIYHNNLFDVNELIRKNHEFAEEIKTLSARLEWAMGQIEIKDALLKIYYD